MKIEILTIGDEVLSGTIVDTNAAWLGDQFWSRGLDLQRHSTVGDEEPAIAAALVEAAGRADAVVVTGGLGPTIDDITIAVAARTFGLPLELHEPSMEAIRERFRAAGREMSPTNEKQALLPKGSSPIPNANGTAPGVLLSAGGASFAFLPGVPGEMKPMFEQVVLPWILARLPDPPAFAARVLRCFGLAEATVQERLLGLETGPVDLAFRPVFPEILLKVSMRGAVGSDLQGRVDAVSAEIRRRLGLHVTSEGDVTMVDVVAERMRERGSTVAVLEFGTGGALCDLMTDRADASDWLVRGVVTTSERSLAASIPVSGTALTHTGVVSAEAAVALAESIRRNSGTTLGLAVLGVPGPAPIGGAGPGTLFVALAAPSGTSVREHKAFRDRSRFKRLSAWVGLDTIRRHLLAG